MARVPARSITAAASWTIDRCGWQFTGSEGLDEAYMPFLGSFGAAWDDGMVARWSANRNGMLWPEMGAAFVRRRGAPTVAVRPVAIIAGS